MICRLWLEGSSVDSLVESALACIVVPASTKQDQPEQQILSGPKILQTWH